MGESFVNVKQVIILRKDLNMRKGKMVAQGAHASLMAYQMHLDYEGEEMFPISHKAIEAMRQRVERTALAFKDWNDPINGYRKVAVGCSSEEELLLIYKKARAAGLIVSIVKDLGLTEFKEPTFTAVAIGPHYDEDIDPITSELSLL
jgi:PTH2 family peptidyl-tRNA hydrolase